MKKFLSCILAITLLIVSAVPVAASENPIQFTDVPPQSWYANSVANMVRCGLINGTSETTFSPKLPVNKAMLATMLWRMAGSPKYVEDEKLDLADVYSRHYYYDAAYWACSHWYVSCLIEPTATADGNLGIYAQLFPNTLVTREDIALALYRYAKDTYGVTASGDLNEFADKDMVSDETAEALAYLVNAGILKGKEWSGRLYLDPAGSATRAEAVCLFDRFMEKFNIG